MKYLLIFLTLLVPASILLPSQAQAQEDASLEVSSSLGKQSVPLKAIKDSDDNIDTQNDFEIQPQNVITVLNGQPFHVLQTDGSLIAVKATDKQRLTTDLQFSQSDGRVNQNLGSGSYLLDIIVEMDNDDRFLYETVLAVLTPGQDLSQVTIQNIIQNFVSSSSSSSSHTTVVFKDDNDNDEDNEDEPSICYFEPNDAPECEPVDGSCPNDWPMNEQGNCHPGGKCPDGFERVDDDESGTCFDTDDTFHCPGSNAIVLDEDDCAIYEPDAPIEDATQLASNDTSDTESEEPLDSNCGGVPCTASEKEDSWLSDGPESSPGVPIEGQEEQSDDEQTEEEQPEQKESSTEDSEQEN